MTTSLQLVVCALLVAVPGTALGAQQLSAMRVGVTTPTMTTLGVRSTVTVPAASSAHRPMRWPYVVGGAVLGAAAGGVWVARQVARNDDAMPFPLIIAAPIVVGAGVGALGGLTVSAIIEP